ncbi:hypothetical protein HYU92_05810 [Candidatus Curtissbacteria bacterium]|nr:hypothetical protein [Candidatus Curtissbacteria bacterium]
MRKGVVPIVILAIVALITVSIAAVGSKVAQKQNTKNQQSLESTNSPSPTSSPGTKTSPKQTNSPTPKASPTPISSQASPTPAPSKINWSTSVVSLEADDFYVTVDAKKFADVGGMHLTSDPGKVNQTLELTWYENDIEMRLNIYFVAEGNNWKVSEVRTYNGQKPGDWIFYNGFSGGEIGKKTTLGTVTWESKAPPTSVYGSYSGTVYFKNLRLQPFLNK